MTSIATTDCLAVDLSTIAEIEGTLGLVVSEDGKLDPVARRVNRLMRGGLERLAASKSFGKASAGQVFALAYPAGMEAELVLVAKLDRRPNAADARRAGARIGAKKTGDALTLLLGNNTRAAEIGFGALLRDYSYRDHKSGDDDPKGERTVTLMVSKPDETKAALATLLPVAEGVFLTRDLTNAPANDLTTDAFADQIKSMSALGLEIEILDDKAMEKLGMRSLLSVGLGTESPSYLGIMKWNGGGDEAPLALVGKGVVFDTGGISLKPASGMEDMTMDMGGAGVVTGVMHALAQRKAKANVIGVVGLVENMPDGKATRPGDVVVSMKGDTIEVINTDAEGRLVLADALWYTQETFKPSGVIDLATLTGAAIIALGHENAAVYANDDKFAGAFLKAAASETEGAWRMPLGSGYADQIKSRVADIKNTGGRPAGSITAAEFLKRFVKDDMPWIHLDIAGVASRSGATPFAPPGATGWGVRALDRLIRDVYEP